MSKASFKKKLTLRNIAILLLVVLLVVALFGLMSYWERFQGVFSDNKTSTVSTGITLGDQHYELNPNVQTVLLMGLDKFEGQIDNSSYNNDQQSDFLMLLVLDNDAQTYSAVHINRDTMVEMNVLGVAGSTIGTVNQQIALAHTYGNGRDVSCHNVADAVSGLLMDTKINHYISVTMDAVPVFNDLLGGVEVEVLDDFPGIDDTLVKGKTVTLMGQQALTYVRTRYGLEDSTNNTRMLRQQQYIRNMLEKMKTCVETNPNFIIDASVNVSDYIISDRSVNQLQTLFEKMSSYTFGGIYSMEGDTMKGEQFMEFYPDADSVKEIVLELFYLPVED